VNLRCRFPPVLAGIVIGVSMLLAWVVSGRGIGASGAFTRIVAVLQHALMPQLTEKSAYFAPYFAGGANPLNDYLIYLLIGLMIGAFVGALSCRDLSFTVQRGPRISNAGRLILALLGGVLTGFAARLARGCTSGQGLVGAAQLSVGAWTFLLCIFAAGFATAWFVRKQWI
jgi:uncharacterized membrane protein YedE/YeeE